VYLYYFDNQFFELECVKTCNIDNHKAF